MNRTERECLLDFWFRRSSESEDQRMERAERMVRNAIEAHDAFRNTDYSIYAKGSYANATNVRADSDVDIVVENHEVFYFAYSPRSIAPAPDPHGGGYSGKWTPTVWRSQVASALNNYFGYTGVDHSGDVAVTVKEVPGSRPSADVVPAFLYQQFDSPDRAVRHEGSRVFSKDGTPINNFPSQQLRNGQLKDRRTGGRYKRYVRALKNAENALARDGHLPELPSYFMECLVWNVPDEVIEHGDIYEGFERSLLFLCRDLDAQRFNANAWEEPNGLKWLFIGQTKWTAEQGRDLSLRTMMRLGFV